MIKDDIGEEGSPWHSSEICAWSSCPSLAGSSDGRTDYRLLYRIHEVVLDAIQFIQKYLPGLILHLRPCSQEQPLMTIRDHPGHEGVVEHVDVINCMGVGLRWQKDLAAD